MTIKKSLVVLPKSLATELLPTPATSDAASLPRERVLRRVRELARHAMVLGVGASAASACIDATQPSPPALGTSDPSRGQGARGGSNPPMVGFGVVDPLPAPHYCPSVDQLESEVLAGIEASWLDSKVHLRVGIPPEQLGGVLLQGFVSTPSLYRASMVDGQGYLFDLSPAPFPGGVPENGPAATPAAGGSTLQWPRSVTLAISFRCTGMPVVYFTVTVALETSSPAASGAIRVTPNPLGDTGASGSDAGSADAG